MFSHFLKRNLRTIAKDVRPIKELTKDELGQIDRLEIKIYNPKSKFNKSIFRTHKYECKIYYPNNNSTIFIEDDTLKSLIVRIKSHIDK